MIAGSDLLIKRAAEGALEKETDFSGYDINLRVVNGIVTLYGIVDTLADKEHAAQVVASVEGVRKVDNDLTVCTDGAVDDRQIYWEVRQELDGDPRLQGTMLKMKVSKGRVILQGEVESAQTREIVLKDVRKAMGVKEIVDNITVASGEGRDDASIVNEVSRRFSAAGIDQNLLEVTSLNGVLSLSGITDKKTKDRALGVAAGVPGVKKVKADRVKTEYNMPTAAARSAARIKKSFAGDQSFAGLPLNIYADGGRLILDGLLANRRQKRAVDKKLHSLLEEYGEEFISVENRIRLRD